MRIISYDFGMRAISWNVNSIRTRMERILSLLERHDPDLLCLQETKVRDEEFPFEAFEEAGYICEIHGQKTYNGVALLSKEELEGVTIGFDGDPYPDQARVISGLLRGIRFINIYVINGKHIEDEKFTMKMKWLKALEEWIKINFSPEEPIVLLGDFNIAPEAIDVHDPKEWKNILFTPEELSCLESIKQWGLEDLFRLHNQDKDAFSWWDYRNQAFRFNKGLRIDLALGTKRTVQCSSGSFIDREERKQGDFEAKPSDHAPLIIDFID